MRTSLGALTATVEAIHTTLSDLEQRTEGGVPDCPVADQTAVQALSVDAPDVVELKLSQPQLYRISGGTMPYQANWIGPLPPDKALTLEYPSNLRIATKAGVTAAQYRTDQTYTLNVYDNRPGAPKKLAKPLIVKTGR
ncbi:MULTISPECIES: hypothetical protein [Azospirillum]|uniref:Uncharacterized protein n=1 Tax=Azospirillum brasilense TaxID=192 RepID=A0A4D8QV05_AZOBR|nr:MULTISPECIES: hypothetical protein [Azospirillum]MDW7557879.1 hypothetical protein [Azospirillum brasilense]MDW7597484.1 hypothetical protein [Azospirillum brasilense]MDW7632677.1 hypothetical protein [Azospirillum brasilense]MDX5950191.1 hypothetical protein [Azospirillum brasilense]OPH11939.1 hypothetical protein FE89_30955 [Azospirillum brasilense]